MTLLQSKEHLFKELNYYKPQMAEKLKGQTLERQVQLWQEDMVRGSIQGALKKTQLFHKERDMKKRLEDNPEDPEAKAYFDKQKKQAQVGTHHVCVRFNTPLVLALIHLLNLSNTFLCAVQINEQYAQMMEVSSFSTICFICFPLFSNIFHS